MLKPNFSSVNLVQCFTEVLTVYCSVKPGKVTMEPTERLPLHHVRMLNLERDYGADRKAAITPWKNVKPGEVTMEPTERLPSHHERMLNLRR